MRKKGKLELGRKRYLVEAMLNSGTIQMGIVVEEGIASRAFRRFAIFLRRRLTSEAVFGKSYHDVLLIVWSVNDEYIVVE